MADASLAVRATGYTAAAIADRHSVDGPRWFESRILCRTQSPVYLAAPSSRSCACEKLPPPPPVSPPPVAPPPLAPPPPVRTSCSFPLLTFSRRTSHILLAASYFLLATWQFAPPPCNLALVLANDNNRRDYDDTSFWTSQTTVGQVSSCGLETTDLKTSAYWSMPLGASIRVVLRGVGGALLGEATYPVLAQVHAYGCYE